MSIIDMRIILEDKKMETYNKKIVKYIGLLNSIFVHECNCFNCIVNVDEFTKLKKLLNKLIKENTLKMNEAKLKLDYLREKKLQRDRNLNDQFTFGSHD